MSKLTTSAYRNAIYPFSVCACTPLHNTMPTEGGDLDNPAIATATLSVGSSCSTSCSEDGERYPVQTQDRIEMEEYNMFHDYLGLVQLVKSAFARENSSSPTVTSCGRDPSPILYYSETARPHVQEAATVRNNGETESFYTSHYLKDAEGKVTCPVLYAYTCPLCGANGDAASTATKTQKWKQHEKGPL